MNGHRWKVRALGALPLLALPPLLGACTAIVDGHRFAHDSASAGRSSVDPGGSAGSPGTPDPGTIVLHRLNRAEYNNTVRDLLGTKLTPADSFPPDGASGGFDNNASALTLSTTELRLMESAAEALAAEAADPNSDAFQRIAPCSVPPAQPCIGQ